MIKAHTGLHITYMIILLFIFTNILHRNLDQIRTIGKYSKETERFAYYNLLHYLAFSTYRAIVYLSITEKNYIFLGFF